MIDIRDLRDDPDRVRTSQQARGEDSSVVDQVLSADETHRRALAEFETARAEQKAFGKKVAQAQGEEKQSLLAQVKDLAARVKSLDAQAQEAATAREEGMRRIGNVVMDGVPVGGEDDFVTLEEVGTPRDFAAEGFEPRDHLALGEALGAIDMARGAKVSGARFYYLLGDGARLEQALMGLAQQMAQEEGFVPAIVPNLVRPETMAGAGFLDAHADEVYRLEADDLYLIGTSEVALAGLHADEILDLSDGPLRYAATSTCYRREAGSYGKDTKGIFRCTSSPRPRCSSTAGSRTPSPSTRTCSGSSGACWTPSSCPTGSSTSPRATSAVRRPVSSTARPGCRRRGSTAS